MIHVFREATVDVVLFPRHFCLLRNSHRCTAPSVVLFFWYSFAWHQTAFHCVLGSCLPSLLPEYLSFNWSGTSRRCTFSRSILCRRFLCFFLSVRFCGMSDSPCRIFNVILNRSQAVFVCISLLVHHFLF